MKKPHILIIDKDHFLRGVYARRLQEGGCNVSYAAHTDEAAQSMQAQTPDAIVCDIEAGDGLSFIRKVKEEKDTANIPVLCVSNAWEDNHQKEAQSIGVSSYMLKAHYSPVEIASAVKSMII